MMTTAVTTLTKRVRWDGPNPRVGNVLLSPAGRIGYLISSVRVLKQAFHNADRPRLQLTCSRVIARQLPDHVTRLPWSRTAPLAARRHKPQQPEPRLPLPVPQPSRTEVANAAARRAKDRRLASETAPPSHADESRWDDPLDDAKTRSPKQIKGHRRGDVVGRLHRKGTDVTRDMALGANAFRCEYDVARIGLTGGDPLADRVGGSVPGPSAGPSLAASKRAAAERSVNRLLRALGKQQSEMLLHVVVESRSLGEWVRAHAERGTAADREKKAFGFLIAVLTRVAEYYGFDERRTDRQNRRENP